MKGTKEAAIGPDLSRCDECPSRISLSGSVYASETDDLSAGGWSIGFALLFNIKMERFGLFEGIVRAEMSSNSCPLNLPCANFFFFFECAPTVIGS